MNCKEFCEQAAAWALGALDDEEARAMDGHLRRPEPHEGCEEAYRRALATTAALVHAIPSEPVPMQAWDRIAPLLRPRGTSGSRARKAVGFTVRETVAWAAAAAASALLFFQAQRAERLDDDVREIATRSLRTELELTRAKDLRDERDACRSELGEAQRLQRLVQDALSLLGAKDTRVVPVAPLPGKDLLAKTLVSGDGKRVLVVSAVRAPAGKDFELWVIRGSAPPEPVGLLRPVDGGVAVAELRAEQLAGGPVDALAISLEPEGGSAAPTEVLGVAKLTVTRGG
jgi:anti-sigma-K factor RskA